MPLLIVAFVFTVDPLSAVLLLVTAPVIPVMMILVGSYAEEHVQRQWTALSRLGAHFLDALRGLPTLKAFGRADDEVDRVASVGEEYRARTMKVLRYAFLNGLVLEFMTSAAIALVAVMLGVRLINGMIPFEEAFLVLLLTPEFFKPLRELGASRHAAMEGKAAAERIIWILDTEPPQPESDGAAPSLTRAPTIVLSGVRFAYPGTRREALCGVDLTLAAGTTTALVGRSGSGQEHHRGPTSALPGTHGRLHNHRWLGPSLGHRPRRGGSASPWCRSGPTSSPAACSRTSGWRDRRPAARR